MIPFFPKQISYRAIVVYLAALIVVSLVYSAFSMQWQFFALGIAFVTCFFLLTTHWTKDSVKRSDKQFVGFLFVLALLLRLVWVIVSYIYYSDYTGSPFGYELADAVAYHETGEWLASSPWSTSIDYFFPTSGVPLSDVGYPIYLTVLYKLFGPVVIIPRVFKAFLSAFMCVLVYRLSLRTFGESTGRMAGIMCALMPNFIIYCGNHLKETEMVFLEVAFLERLDFLLRNRKIRFWSIFFPTILAFSLFFFRTVLGAAAVFTAATAVLLSSAPAMRKVEKKLALAGWGVLCLAVLSGGTIMTEIESYWEEKDVNASSKRYEQTLRGNQWAQYATGAVMAPMAFVLPFSTMVDVDQQYGQQEKHGGNYIRNFMGFFAILAVYEAFRRKKWRDFALIGSFVIAYLGVVALSGFSNSERFLLPGLPGLIMMWAYGVSALREKTYKLLTPWCFIVLAMEVAWAYFKLGSRGLF